jgi:NADPH:quinone reductase-like Zn-dependent oxidoreductase
MSMRAAVTPAYGPPTVLTVRDLPRPTPRDHEVLVAVRAAAVTAGDARLRSADFPSVSAWPGRLFVGVRRPRHAVQGTMFAGRIVAIGGAVTRHAVGDDVFGFVAHGAYAELLTIAEGGALATLPAGVAHHDAVAIPYGGGTALRFLRDVAQVRAGERVLILGAAGGVGRSAVQLARHLGAHVTAACSPRSFDLVRSLGAEGVVESAEAAATSGQRWDVVFDAGGVASFRAMRPALTARGRYLTVQLSLGLLRDLVLGALFGGPRAQTTIAQPTREDMTTLRDLAEAGALRPIVAARFPLERIVDAHLAAVVERSRGSVVIDLAPPSPALASDSAPRAQGRFAACSPSTTPRADRSPPSSSPTTPAAAG